MLLKEIKWEIVYAFENIIVSLSLHYEKKNNLFYFYLFNEKQDS